MKLFSSAFIAFFYHSPLFSSENIFVNLKFSSVALRNYREQNRTMSFSSSFLAQILNKKVFFLEAKSFLLDQVSDFLELFFLFSLTITGKYKKS